MIICSKCWNEAELEEFDHGVTIDEGYGAPKAVTDFRVRTECCKDEDFIELEDHETICSECHTVLDQADEFCFECGVKMESED